MFVNKLYVILVSVPQKYPLNEELIKLSMVNAIENIGLGEFFTKEIEHVLQQVYR